MSLEPPYTLEVINVVLKEEAQSLYSDLARLIVARQGVHARVLVSLLKGTRFDFD